MDYEQKLIADVLHYAHLAEMPEKMLSGSKSLWIEAIAKIKKADGNVGYGIVKRNADLSYRVVYVNGSTSTIVDLIEIYPYINLDSKYIKKFTKKDDMASRIQYLRSMNLPYFIDYETSTIDDLNKEIVKAAVYQQLKALEE